MKDNRNKWLFIKHPTKPALDNTQVRYWKETMFRLLKVGLEFEFNLPNQRGSCKGDDVACPCGQMDNGCWKECENNEVCSKKKNIETCSNKKSKCKSTTCEDCNNFLFYCLSTSCTEFVSLCFNKCPDFMKNCDTCDKRYNPDKDPSHIRNELHKIFNPTNDYTKVNKSGVVKIVEDGSLEGGGGMEIITVGRRIDYWEFYNMSKAIIDEAVRVGAYLNERTGSHMHLLTTYYADNNIGKFVTELEKTMPEIILANFHQLCRRYQNPITWMTMALDNPNNMTRWEKFRVSILGISPVQRDMVTLRDKVAHDAGGRKYGWVNYNEMRFDAAGDITAFHVELRGADSTMCPSYYAALACLYVAFAIKAVEISKYGLLKIGDEKSGWIKKAQQAKNTIMNNMGGYDGPRISDTSEAIHFREYFIEEGMDMLTQMKGILMRIGPAYDVLSKLILKPPALYRCEGISWADIEKDIEVVISQSGKLDNKLQEIIDLHLLEECENIDEWVKCATEIIQEENQNDIDELSENDVKDFTELKMRDGLIIWSDSIGSVISV